MSVQFSVLFEHWSSPLLFYSWYQSQRSGTVVEVLLSRDRARAQSGTVKLVDLGSGLLG